MAPRQQKLTGEEVGRLVLQDLAAIHLNAFNAARGEAARRPVMTPAEKAERVNSLIEPAEVAAYNGYRYFHEFLSRAALYFNVHQQNADSRFWQIYGRLDALWLSEEENRTMLLEMPKIMTRAQYDQARSLFNPSGGARFGRGVAIVETDGFPDGTYRITKSGQFQYAIPGSRQINLAENFLKEEGEYFTVQLTGYRAALKEALVIKAAFEVFGKFLEVPELSSMVLDIDLKQVDRLNHMLTYIPKSVVRRGFLPGETPEDELRSKLADLLRPIETKNLRPSARLRAKALRQMDFSVAQGQAEKIYDILRQETAE